MTIIEYVTEEVERQGHDTTRVDGLQRVGWMLDAWAYALRSVHAKPVMGDAIVLGILIEPVKNEKGTRMVPVRVGNRMCPAWDAISDSLSSLFQHGSDLTPIEFYKQFEEIHPFVDGNGRTGKILLNWLNGTLLEPVFPPGDLWGVEIRNP